VARHNLHDFEALCALMAELGIVFWEVFFLVPMGRARPEDVASAESFEEVFHRLYDLSKSAPFDIKATAAPHYGRVVLQRKQVEKRQGAQGVEADTMTAGLRHSLTDGIGRARNVNDGDGFMFVSHMGDLYPSGFLPLKAGNVRRDDLVEVYRVLANRCDFPLHLGLTEAGLGAKGIIASTAGLSILLQEGIGDTIRVSLTPQPDGDRADEVRVAQQILQSLGLRSFSPQVTACPGCGRTTSTFFQQMAQEIQEYLRNKMPVWRTEHPGVEDLKVAVMGCVVNGPGESKHANLGISLPGTFEEPKAPVYVDGRHLRTLKGPRIAQEFMMILEDYVRQRYPAQSRPSSRSPGGPPCSRCGSCSPCPPPKRGFWGAGIWTFAGHAAGFSPS
jgi:hypothetical protein